MTPDRPFERAFSVFDDLNPDTPLPEWEPALAAYAGGPVVRKLTDGAACVTGWQALRDMARIDDASVRYVTDNCPASRHAQAHACLWQFGLASDPGGTRRTRKIRTTRAVSNMVDQQQPLLAAVVAQAFARLERARGAVDLQMGFAMPLALAAIAVAHGEKPDQQDLSRRLYPSIHGMRHLFDFLHHDRAIENAGGICDALTETIATLCDHYRNGAPDRGLYAALKAAGDDQPEAVLAGLNLAGASPIADSIRWMMWKAATDPGYRAALAGVGATRAFALNHLRLYPQPLMYRELAAQARIGGVDLPAGTKLFGNMPAAGRDPRVMADPGSFGPGNAPFARLMFGDQSRRCAGVSYAVEMIQLVAVQAAQIAERIHVAPSGPMPTVGQFRNASTGVLELSLR